MKEDRYVIRITSRRERVMNCWAAMPYYIHRRLLGVYEMPAIDVSNGDGYIIIERGNNSYLPGPLRRWLSALVTVGLARRWSHEIIKNGETTIIEEYPVKSEAEEDEG
jgi:hypothetical protein